MTGIAYISGHHGRHSLLVMGIILVAISILHLVFRNFYVRRSTAMQQARAQTAPGFTRGLVRPISEQGNRAVIIGGSVVMFVVGIVLIAVGA